MESMDIMDMDADKVQEITGDHQRFVSPFSEPYGYYICAKKTENISNASIQKYWEKLEYMSENVDLLIQQAFKPEFYDFSGVDKSCIASADEMCRQLVVDSFVLFVEDNEIGCCLSNTQFMPGYFIDCLWSDSWELIYSYIC